MTISVPCPICSVALDVPETTDEFGNPFWDANGTIAAHIATAHSNQQGAPQ